MCVKTAISIPDSIFRAAEKLAKHLGFSRSELYSKAVAEYLQKHRNDGTTRKLDEIYAKKSSLLDPAIQALQSASIDEEEW